MNFDHSCTLCGDEVMLERWQLGYHYCMKPKCQLLGVARAAVLIVGQHKGPPLVIAAHSSEALNANYDTKGRL